MADAHEIASRMRAEAKAAPAKAAKATAIAGQFYAGQVAKDAPYDTGDYARSINAQTATTDLLRPTEIVGTNKPQGPRLEYGFTGADSRGRVFNQQPRPHFRKHLRAGLAKLQKEMSKAFGK